VVATSENMDDLAADVAERSDTDGDPNTGPGGEYWAKRQARRQGGMSSEEANRLEEEEARSRKAERYEERTGASAPV
jgi:hypothetical protein